MFMVSLLVSVYYMFVCLFVRYWRCHVHGVPSHLNLLHVCLSGIGGAMFMVSLLVSIYYMFVCLFVRYWRCHVHGVPSRLSLLQCHHSVGDLLHVFLVQLAVAVGNLHETLELAT